MIFGFNTDVPADGQTYHVQTEDRGAKNPVVDSIVYLGGKIIDRVRTTYDLSASTQEQIETLVRAQHRDLVESIRSGTFAAPATAPEQEGPPPSGYGIRLLNPHEIQRDDRLCFDIEVWNRKGPGPGADIALDVRWIAANKQAEKAELKTKHDGRVEVSFSIPEENTEAALLVCAIGHEGQEIAKFRVRQGTASGTHI